MATDSAIADIAICGAGPVGLTLALHLVKCGVPAARIALIDAKTLEQTVHDPRSIALSYGSRQILERAGAWPIAATAIEQIHASRRGQFGRTLIDCADYRLPALGYVTRYGAIVAALHAGAAQAGIRTLRPARLCALQEQDDGVTLQLEDAGGPRTLHAQLVAQAEGGVFSEQAAKALHRDYDQVGLIAHVTCSAPLAQRAFERFTEEGPLALLPQHNGYALVWCCRPARADQLLQLDEPAFLAALQQAFGHRLGTFCSSSARLAYPLGLNAHPAATARTVTIGNAAQTLHPVAGQGLNLGLRDAAVLARLLAKQPAPAGLAAFQRARQDDRGRTIRLTDALARVFASAADDAPSQALLGLSLGLLDAAKPVKRLLAQQMLFGLR
ncbi:FAD-dependent monooxygenase [Herminiimonas sp. CN]|uniref:FAD-dependent monooxygenase n=1 Tax=Herminiimonas sp. CN TaxID=1349818 RepID=UPI000473AC43|nr:FAD-dependent monooxygenase [Herminiimonas sp. CN]